VTAVTGEGAFISVKEVPELSSMSTQSMNCETQPHNSWREHRHAPQFGLGPRMIHW
jgi:hypothetical protein